MIQVFRAFSQANAGFAQIKSQQMWPHYRGTPKREKTTEVVRTHHQTPVPKDLNSPTLLLPKKRPVLVEEAGGGGFWICEAVGARDWRME